MSHLSPLFTSVPVVVPDEVTTDSSYSSGWIVVVYNNEYNTWDEVMAILMIATNCTPDEAYMETWEVDNLGRSVVHHGDEATCRAAADIIATIGIQVEVSEE